VAMQSLHWPACRPIRYVSRHGPSHFVSRTSAGWRPRSCAAPRRALRPRGVRGLQQSGER